LALLPKCYLGKVSIFKFPGKGGGRLVRRPFFLNFKLNWRGIIEPFPPLKGIPIIYSWVFKIRPFLGLPLKRFPKEAFNFGPWVRPLIPIWLILYSPQLSPNFWGMPLRKAFFLKVALSSIFF